MNCAKAFLTILLIACFVFLVNGQKSLRKNKAGVKSALCQINEVSFQCPKGFSNLFKDEKVGLQLFQDNEEKDFGLFIAVPGQEFDETRLYDDLTKSIIGKLFPMQPQDYEWKKADLVRFADSETLMSKNQISSKTIKGYNKKHLVFGNFRHINFNNKHFIVGYFIEIDKSKDAAEQFQTEFADAGYITCNAQLKLIYSITGEKLKKGEEPCEVTVTVDQ